MYLQHIFTIITTASATSANFLYFTFLFFYSYTSREQGRI